MPKAIGIVVVAAFAARGRYHGHSATDQVGGQFWQPGVVIVRKAKFDRYVAALDETSFAQAFAERRDGPCAQFGHSGVEEPDHRHPRLLRERDMRPCDCATDNTEEFPSPHVRPWAQETTS
jgi:hypothetical protein